MQLKAGAAVRRLRHLVARPLQVDPQDPADRCLVVDDQDARDVAPPADVVQRLSERGANRPPSRSLRAVSSKWELLAGRIHGS
jgi:hypothetical protein